jgi:hypothetical protein
LWGQWHTVLAWLRRADLQASELWEWCIKEVRLDEAPLVEAFVIQRIPGENCGDRHTAVHRAKEPSHGRHSAHIRLESLQLVLVDKVGFVEHNEVGQANLRRSERQFLLSEAIERITVHYRNHRVHTKRRGEIRIGERLHHGPRVGNTTGLNDQNLGRGVAPEERQDGVEEVVSHTATDAAVAEAHGVFG